ncbi:unnamed protein product [Medioppia subpectinata]|uniref:POU domain protein n=1 Tax=Medioppia subpectinata TaxID=1979941 RepID=A0A7R9KHX9_9ACAR|nr:unnamed protein product [Medioppia subpectinata]CAG2104010.1 unnamed protein product [Medioppia subpectinata]
MHLYVLSAVGSPSRTSFSPPSPYTPTSIHHRDMRRHCPTMTPNPHHNSPSSTNIFAAAGLDAAAAELHDLSNRNQANIKPDMSSMAYHHHMMQSRQHHPSEMHEFLTGDPMSGSLPSALGLAAQASDASHHPGSSSSAQLHAPSALYSAHSHHHNPMNVNGMIPGLHHHPSATQLTTHHMQNPFHHHPHNHGPHHPHHHSSFVASSPHHVSADPSLLDADPRELEAFAERFKQRRIKLGVTQADVGKALANLKLPGVGSLSQSTICRFESLTLSHNNMVALKPILQAWLEAAEAQARKNRNNGRDGGADLCVLPSSDKKRKRTSIAAPEKRSLEAYFSVQPRPSGEKIAAIAEKLDLKKNVVRVWFCNQRQKQKRMKYSAVNGPGGQQQ